MLIPVCVCPLVGGFIKDSWIVKTGREKEREKERGREREKER